MMCLQWGNTAHLKHNNIDIEDPGKQLSYKAEPIDGIIYTIKTGHLLSVTDIDKRLLKGNAYGRLPQRNVGSGRPSACSTLPGYIYAGISPVMTTAY